MSATHNPPPPTWDTEDVALLTYIVQTRASLEPGSRGELDGIEIVDDEVALYHSSSWKRHSVSTRRPYVGDSDDDEEDYAEVGPQVIERPMLEDGVVDGRDDDVDDEDEGSDREGGPDADDIECEDLDDGDDGACVAPSCVADILIGLDLTEVKDYVYHAGTKLGKLQVSFGSTSISLRSYCSTHGDGCELWMSGMKDYFVRYGLVLSWLKDGPVQSRDAHMRASEQIRINLGIGPKTLRRA